jgi:hypothetical protein
MGIIPHLLIDYNKSSKMIKAINVILLLIVFTTCNNKQYKGDKSLTLFDLTSTAHPGILKLSDLNVTEIKYVSLETNDSLLINHIRKIVVSGSNIFITDYNSTFYRYGKDGNLKNSFNRKGKGPKEYTDSYDFTIDSKTQDIYICSLGNKKILHYTKLGEFINAFASPEGTLEIMYAEGNILCNRPNSQGYLETCLVLVDFRGTVIKKFPNIYKYNSKSNLQFGYINEIIWYEYNSSLYIKDLHSDTVFLFKNKQFAPQYVLNHGGKTISSEARSMFDTENKFRELGKNYSVEIEVWRIGDFIISVFMHGDGRLFIYAGKINGAIEYLANLKSGILNNFDGGPNLRFTSFCRYDDNTILAWVDAYELKAHVASKAFKTSTPKYPEKKKELEHLANSLSENDNPVLMLVKLKDY